MCLDLFKYWNTCVWIRNKFCCPKKYCANRVVYICCGNVYIVICSGFWNVWIKIFRRNGSLLLHTEWYMWPVTEEAKNILEEIFSNIYVHVFVSYEYITYFHRLYWYFQSSIVSWILKSKFHSKCFIYM